MTAFAYERRRGKVPGLAFSLPGFSYASISSLTVVHVFGHGIYWRAGDRWVVDLGAVLITPKLKEN